jgi:hypothetical protein
MRLRILLTSAVLGVSTMAISGALTTVAAPAASAATAATATSTTAATDKQVAAVRAEVARINKGLAKLKKTTMMVENVSAEGTEATYYRSGKSIRKISAVLLGETYQAHIDLYYASDKLIFAFDRHSRYQEGLGSPIASTIDYRVYYAEGKYIRASADNKRLTDDEASYEVDSLNEISVELKAAIA